MRTEEDKGDRQMSSKVERQFMEGKVNKGKEGQQRSLDVNQAEKNSQWKSTRVNEWRWFNVS